MATEFPQFHKLSAKLPKRAKTSTPAVNTYLRETLIDARIQRILARHGVYPTFNERILPRSKAGRSKALQELGEAEKSLSAVSDDLTKLRNASIPGSGYPDEKAASRVVHYVGNFLTPMHLDIRAKRLMIQQQGVKSRRTRGRSS